MYLHYMYRCMYMYVLFSRKEAVELQLHIHVFTVSVLNHYTCVAHIFREGMGVKFILGCLLLNYESERGGRVQKEKEIE